MSDYEVSSNHITHESIGDLVLDVQRDILASAHIDQETENLESNDQ